MPHFFIGGVNVGEGVNSGTNTGVGRTNETALSNTIAPPLIIIKDADNYRHIARSLRARTGEKLLLIDENQIQYETVIKEINSKEIICEIEKSYLSKRDLDFDLFLAQSPLRSDSQLTIMEKATELGVRAVYPVFTDNCALKVNKREKWQKVMYEASKQCERAKIPTCFEPQTFDEILKNKFDKIIVFAERSTEKNLKQYLKENPIHKGEKVLVIIGPEGGFSQREFDYFKAKNLPLISLGDLILKADTAVITALGDIIYEYQG